MKKTLSALLLILFVSVFFKQFFFHGLFPIPSDALVGLYHPYRDALAANYPNGIPFKNSLITDPIRQQYPWRQLSIEIISKLQLPLWNPYNFSGAPLLGNIQSSVLYPLNFLFFTLPFPYAWSFLIFLQPVLASVFLFYYLYERKVHPLAAFIGGVVFAFSGFMISWMEWNTIDQVALWLPLLLLAVDKFFVAKNDSKRYGWLGIIIISLCMSFLAGHWQTFLYVIFLVFIYFTSMWYMHGRQRKIAIIFFMGIAMFLLLTAIQWVASLQFITLSGREADQILNWQNDGWFIPWQHLVQFVAPDFFGNPTTLNYWGVWNYAEFVGYIGVIPFIFAIYALLFRKDKKTLLFGSVLFLSFLFSLPTFVGKLPYALSLPFISSTQPSRILFLIDFSLAVLAALGVDLYLRERRRKIFVPIIILFILYIILWIGVVISNTIFNGITYENIQVAKSNLQFPTLIFFASAILLFLLNIIKNKPVEKLITVLLISVCLIDLSRFAYKFTPFTSQAYLYPQTKTISYLIQHAGINRIMTTDDRILPSNVSTFYKLQNIDGYDPLYLRRYGEFMAVINRNKPDITPPFGFNRIVSTHRYDSELINMLGVKYVLSYGPINSPTFEKVLQEGKTYVYKNKSAYDRAYFVPSVNYSIHDAKNDVIAKLFLPNNNLRKLAIVEISSGGDLRNTFSVGKAEFVSYSENTVTIKTTNNGEGFLILTDINYPSWHAYIDGKETKIYQTNYIFRGIMIPKGEHSVQFSISFI